MSIIDRLEANALRQLDQRQRMLSGQSVSVSEIADAKLEELLLWTEQKTGLRALMSTETV